VGRLADASEHARRRGPVTNRVLEPWPWSVVPNVHYSVPKARRRALMGELHTPTLLRHEGEYRRHVPAGRVAGNSDPGDVESATGPLFRDPLSCGVALLDLDRILSLRCSRVFDEHNSHPPPCMYKIAGNRPMDPCGLTIRSLKSPRADDKVTHDSSTSGIEIGADWAVSTAWRASASETLLVIGSPFWRLRLARR
jgi:hypothetical protein